MPEQTHASRQPSPTPSSSSTGVRDDKGRRDDAAREKSVEASRCESVVDLLHRTLYQHRVLVFLSDDHAQIAFDGPAGQVIPGDVRDAILAREAEVRGHLLASPGIRIANYPRDLAIASHGFQEIRIAERRKRRKVVEVVVGGVTATRWFDDPPGWRLREIARELGMQRLSNRKLDEERDDG